MKKIIALLLKWKPIRWLMEKVIPYIRFSTYYVDFTGTQYHKLYNVLQPGDVILTTDDKKLTGLLIPGFMDHAAVCVAKYATHGFEVVQMTHKDFTMDCFFDVCKESTRVIIMRCKDFDADYTKRFCKKAMSFRFAKYDKEFKLGVEALYCSELPYQADFEKRAKVDLSDAVGLGGPYISPMGWLFGANMVCVADSDERFTGFPGTLIQDQVKAGYK